MNINEQFPIASQLSEKDRQTLLKLINLFEKYNYCEIGSFLGGSLAPHIKSDKCLEILSIDDRGRIQQDERGIDYSYEEITSQMMIDNLKKLDLNLEKLTVFDKSIEHLPAFEKKYDLVFIDGEHTDISCFRDFLYSMKLVTDSGIIAFHDSTIVYKGIQSCLIYLEANKINYKFIKVPGCEMSMLFLGNYPYEEFEEEDKTQFYINSERHRISWLTTNRPIINNVVSNPKIEVCRAFT